MRYKSILTWKISLFVLVAMLVVSPVFTTSQASAQTGSVTQQQTANKASQPANAADLSAASGQPARALQSADSENLPITLKTMGSLLFGGTLNTSPDGSTFHGDHGYAQFYVPQHARTYPLIMWHGMGQSGRSWESTPDGREGFQAIMTRRDWPVYIIDQPRRGRAGYTNAAKDDPNLLPTSASENGVWDAFRNGIWRPGQKATVYPSVQFSMDPNSVDQFFRQQTFNTGVEPQTPEHRKFLGKTMAALLEQTGPAVLITHSMSGQYGWYSAMAAPEKIKAVVAYEPGAFVFPEGERPADVPSKVTLVDEVMMPRMVSAEEFNTLTKMPIFIIYGDNIATEPGDVFNVEVWRVASTRAKQFVDTVNRHGGNAKFISLPEIGLKGNTHAPFSDLNNVQVADHLESLLHSVQLGGRDTPHQGPTKKKVEMSIPLEQ